MNKSNTNFLKWVFERISFYVRNQKLPSWPYRYRSKLNSLELFIKCVRENPIRALRFCAKFFYQRKGFILLIFGPRVLKDTVLICDSLGLKPFLLFGTLRGYMIRKDFLSKNCSGDMDLGLLEDDYRKAPLIKEAMCQKGYIFCQDNGYELLFVHPQFPSLFIDFFCVYKKDNHTVITTELDLDRKIMYTQYFPLDIFDEFRNMLFHKVKVFVPSKFEQFLLIHYGQQWKDQVKKFQARGDHKNEKVEKLEPISDRK